MLTAIILVCALTIPARDCDINTAEDVRQVPPPMASIGDYPQPSMAFPGMCLKYGQEWAGEHMPVDRARNYIKVRCLPEHQLPRNVG